MSIRRSRGREAAAVAVGTWQPEIAQAAMSRRNPRFLRDVEQQQQRQHPSESLAGCSCHELGLSNRS